MALWYTRLTLVTLLAPLTGCAMCACPYDYAGPTYNPSSGEPPYGDYRAGSVMFAGGPGVMPDGYQGDNDTGEMDDRRQPTPAEGSMEQLDDPLQDPIFDVEPLDESLGGIDNTDDDALIMPDL